MKSNLEIKQNKHSNIKINNKSPDKILGLSFTEQALIDAKNDDGSYRLELGVGIFVILITIITVGFILVLDPAKPKNQSKVELNIEQNLY